MLRGRSPAWSPGLRGPRGLGRRSQPGVREEVPACRGLGCKGGVSERPAPTAVPTTPVRGSTAGTRISGLSAAGWRRGRRGGGPVLGRAGRGCAGGSGAEEPSAPGLARDGTRLLRC
jgi:hypothetical protein